MAATADSPEAAWTLQPDSCVCTPEIGPDTLHKSRVSLCLCYGIDLVLSFRPFLNLCRNLALLLVEIPLKRTSSNRPPSEKRGVRMLHEECLTLSRWFLILFLDFLSFLLCLLFRTRSLKACRPARSALTVKGHDAIFPTALRVCVDPLREHSECLLRSLSA